MWQLAPSVLRAWGGLKKLKVLCLALDMHVGGTRAGAGVSLQEAAFWHVALPLLPDVTSDTSCDSGAHTHCAADVTQRKEAL